MCLTSVISWSWSDQKLNLDTCEPEIDKVDDEQFTLSYATDATVMGFELDDKKNVEFLPTNFLQTFPDLIAIQFWNCSLQTIENHFKGLSKLQNLKLAYNKISNIADDAFVDLVNLENLALNYNRIQFLGAHIFDTLAQLEILSLNNNQIKVVQPEIFSSLVKIENINLDQNKISTVDEKLLEKAESLEFVSFTGNKMGTVPKNFFKTNLKLEKIWLNLNNIKFIDANMFDHLSNLERVDFESNACIDKIYDENNLYTLQYDLKLNCTQNPVKEESRQKKNETTTQGI